ncbi:hypothetical protein ABW19_dt0208780 [Dactylella cylindrospora]|nr:hypothetical protein ABW19_dt0208780 [Dactylella cylindrospora]
MPGVQPQTLPTHFPCWVKAIYSWGGETKRDLGFVEGDLIECLNAGDGAWWMGRLKRDRRQVGLFPSNFVEVLPDNRPVTPIASPVKQHGYSNSRSCSPAAYNNSDHRGPSPNPYQQQRGVSPNPYQQNRGVSPSPYHQNRAVSPNPHAQNRGVSPNPYQQNGAVSPSGYGQYRATSPRPPIHNQHRAVSPNPYPYQQNMDYHQGRPTTPNTLMQQHRPMTPNGPISRSGTPNPYQNSLSQGPSPSPFHMPQRAKSPAPFRAVSPSPMRPVTPSAYNGETPPPAPPVHGNGYYSRAASPAPSFQQQNRARSPMPSRGPTPQASPHMMAHTPSPLRSAMDDVLSSLDEMSVVDGGRRSPMPFGPDDYENRSSSSAMRSHTSQGFRSDNVGGFGSFDGIEIGSNPRRHEHHGISNFVERMEESLRDQNSGSYYGSNDETFDQIRQLKQQNMARPSSVMMARPGSSTTSDTSFKRRSVWDIDSRRPNLSRQSTVQSNGSSAVFSTTSNSTAATSASIMSGMSAGGFSATSAGSFIRHKQRAAMNMAEQNPHPLSQSSPFSTFSPMDNQMVTNNGIVFHSGNVSPERTPMTQTWGNSVNTGNGLGGLSSLNNMSPTKKKGGFFKKILASAKASTATARSMAASPTPESDPAFGTNRFTGIAGGNIPMAPQPQDWVQVRRDVARSNTISRNERIERQEKQEMMDVMTLRPVEILEEECDGDEAADGGLVELPQDFANLNMTQVDKAARFIGSLPSGTTPAILANAHICRPHRSDVQRLRAMFTWLAEKLSWERPMGLGLDSPSDMVDYNRDCRRVIQSLKATTEEVAIIFMQMCHSIGIACEIIKGYLKVPGDSAEADAIPQPNHYWNAVIIDNEWRIVDASLASPTHPKRGLYSSAPNNLADFHYFLMRPTHACFTHIPLMPQHQHLIPPMPYAVLMALPCTSAGFFNNSIQMINFDTSLLRIEDLEIVQVDFQVPIDVECVAEVEANGFALDADGDVFESGDIVKKGALAQVAWEGPLGNIQKTYRIKAVLPGDEGQGILKVYAGPRGLMHSIKDNPHPLAFTLPITHTGTNPTYNFVTRHPTPHAQRHDLYIVQPQNLRLAFDNTYVFAVRQHASTILTVSDMAALKGAKLAIQTPSGKIMKIGRRADSLGSEHGQVFEQSIKVTERGPWRGLVLADRSARWCVFAEWICV